MKLPTSLIVQQTDQELIAKGYFEDTKVCFISADNESDVLINRLKKTKKTRLFTNVFLKYIADI